MNQHHLATDAALSTILKLDEKNSIAAMKEFTGIKIIEAVDMLVKDFPRKQKELLLSNIDAIINIVL